MDDVGKLLRRTKEFVRTGKKAGRNGIQAYRRPFLSTCCQTRQLEDRLLNSAPCKAHTDGTGLTVVSGCHPRPGKMFGVCKSVGPSCVVLNERKQRKYTHP